jgi:protocatechuate 3,4-dioxygenase beta subunit
MGAAFLAACGDKRTSAPNDLATPLHCVVTPSETEGPFFVDEKLNRSDLTQGTSEPFVVNGMPLALTWAVYTVAGSACTPLPGAQLDVWHASAEGVYSDEPSGAIQSKDTTGESYLRGYQLTDADGAAHFQTIYPGWYPGRTIHIHFKVRWHGYEFTSQLYIDDAINDEVMAQAPYNTRGDRTVRNLDDSVFAGGVDGLALAVQKSTRGYIGNFAIGLQF